VLVVCVFALIAHTSLAFFDHPVRQQFVGAVSMASLISMFASPLAVMVRLNFQRELLSNFIKKESS
jgi:solute carrier family 50 (sugar transporter)